MNWQYILKAGPWNVRDKQLYYESTFVSRINDEYYRKFDEAAIDKSVNSMLNGVWEQLQRTQNVDIIPYTRTITIEGESGTPYQIRMASYPDYCKFDVVGSKETPIGYFDIQICVDSARELPYGDILASNILALVNDWTSANRVHTINELLTGTFYTEVHCPFCDEMSNAIPHQEITKEYSCPDCNVFSCILETSDETGEANHNWFRVDTSYHAFTCPICKDELEMLSNGDGYCEKDRFYFSGEERYPLMKLYGELIPSEDYTDLHYDGKNYRYIGEGLEVEEEE